MRPRPERRQRAAGFTLIETLVAFTMLASVLAVLMQNLGTGIRHQRLSATYLEALTLAESKLAEFASLSGEIPTEVTSPPGAPLAWTVTLTPYVPPAPATDAPVPDSAVTLYRIDVVVAWPARGGLRTLEVSSLRAAPGADA